MLKDPTEFRQSFAARKKGVEVYNAGIPYDDDNHNLEYDHARAAQLGYTADETGHYPTRDYETGRYLKSPAHPTIMKSIVTDLGMGYIPYYNNKDGQMYSNTWMKLPRFGGGKNPWDDSTDFITSYEGFKDTTYQNKGDVPTIGYGTTSKKWVSKGKITKAQARQAMSEDLAMNEPLLRKNIKNYDSLPDSAKTVLRDILYNVGQGNMFNKSPKFMKALNAGDWQAAAANMDWDNNKPGMGGARKRNAARQELFLRDLGKRVLPYTPPAVEQIEQMPIFEPIEMAVPNIPTDYSLTNRYGGALNAWKGSDSPAYGGFNLRMPSLRETIEMNLQAPNW